MLEEHPFLYDQMPTSEARKIIVEAGCQLLPEMFEDIDSIKARRPYVGGYIGGLLESIHYEEEAAAKNEETGAYIVVASVLDTITRDFLREHAAIDDDGKRVATSFAGATRSADARAMVVEKLVHVYETSDGGVDLPPLESGVGIMNTDYLSVATLKPQEIQALAFNVLMNDSSAEVAYAADELAARQYYLQVIQSLVDRAGNLQLRMTKVLSTAKALVCEQFDNELGASVASWADEQLALEYVRQYRA